MTAANCSGLGTRQGLEGVTSLSDFAEGARAVHPETRSFFSGLFGCPGNTYMVLTITCLSVKQLVLLSSSSHNFFTILLGVFYVVCR